MTVTQGGKVIVATKQVISAERASNSSSGLAVQRNDLFPGQLAGGMRSAASYGEPVAALATA